MDVTDEDDRVRVRIEAPLPLNFAGALMTLIGSAWPDTQMSTNTSRGIAMELLVPNDPPVDVDAECLEEIRKSAETAEMEVELQGVHDGWLAFAPPEELQLHLGGVAHSIMCATEGATNYVEWTITTGTEPADPSYVLSIARSKLQTPHELRMAAEKKLEQRERQCEQYLALLQEHGIEVPF